MVFSSIPFLYYFLPIVLLAYFLIPVKGRNAVLLLASLIFYAWGEPVYVFLMLVSVAVGYLAGLLLGKYREKKPGGSAQKAVLTVSVLLFLSIFVSFKYTDFFINNFNSIFEFGGINYDFKKL